MLTVLTILAAVASALSLVLHAVAPHTKNTYDDKFEDIVDEVLAYLGQVDKAGQPLDKTTDTK